MIRGTHGVQLVAAVIRRTDIAGWAGASPPTLPSGAARPPRATLSEHSRRAAIRRRAAPLRPRGAIPLQPVAGQPKRVTLDPSPLSQRGRRGGAIACGATTSITPTEQIPQLKSKAGGDPVCQKIRDQKFRRKRS